MTTFMGTPGYDSSLASTPNSSAPRSSLQAHTPSSPRASLQNQLRPQGDSIQRAPVPENASISYNTLRSLAITDLELWLAEQKVRTLDDLSSILDIDLTDHAPYESPDPKHPKHKPRWYHKRYFGYVDDGFHVLHLSALWFEYIRKKMREGFRTNPYGLDARYFMILWFFLVGSAVGTVVATRWDPYDDLVAGRRRRSVIYANLLKGLFSALPLLTTATVFMFPPLYTPF